MLCCGQVVQWMVMADNEILPAACTWVFPTMGIMQFNKNATDRAKEDIKAALKTLNDHLLTRTFLVGERVTLADISVACTMISLYKPHVEQGRALLHQHPAHVKSWQTRETQGMPRHQGVHLQTVSY